MIETLGKLYLHEVLEVEKTFVRNLVSLHQSTFIVVRSHDFAISFKVIDSFEHYVLNSLCEKFFNTADLTYA
jgi:hypothetical protein